MTRAAIIAAFATLVAAGRLTGQTDYYNTGAGRPMRIEDAVSVEYRAIELNFLPLRWESAPNAAHRWTLEPEAAIGIFPRTQLQLGVPMSFIDTRTTSTRGVSGLEVALMHTLNAETSIPAIALAADALLPVGSLAAESAYGTLKGMLTRTTRLARVHVNAQYTIGPSSSESDDDAADVEASRWLAGIAIDKTLPLRSVLFSVEGFAEQPLSTSAAVEWNAGAGARLQLSPRWALDAGVGRRLTGDDRAWYVTFGSAYAVGIP